MGGTEDRKRALDWKWSGSYTVEAAFVVPIILGILFAWMFEVFYFHDQVVLSGMMQQQVIKKAGNMQEYSTEEIKKELQGKLWLLEILSVKERKKLGKVNYGVQAAVTWDIPIMKDFLKGAVNYQRKWSCYNTPPDYLLRFQE